MGAEGEAASLGPGRGRLSCPPTPLPDTPLARPRRPGIHPAPGSVSAQGLRPPPSSLPTALGDRGGAPPRVQGRTPRALCGFRRAPMDTLRSAGRGLRPLWAGGGVARRREAGSRPRPRRRDGESGVRVGGAAGTALLCGAPCPLTRAHATFTGPRNVWARDFREAPSLFWPSLMLRVVG